LVVLLRDVLSASFADDRNFDRAGITHFLLDLFFDFASDDVGLRIVDFVWFDDDADFASSLDGKRLFNTSDRIGDFFQLCQAFDIVFKRFTTGTRSCGRERIGGRYQHTNDGFGFGIAVMAFDAIDDGRMFTLFIREGDADVDMGAFDFVINGFADIV